MKTERRSALKAIETELKSAGSSVAVVKGGIPGNSLVQIDCIVYI
jgi:hypothetical protein